MNILQINASIRAEAANSTRLADQITARLKQKNPTAQLTLRDLGLTPPPLFDAATLLAFSTAAEQRTPAQIQRIAHDDALIAELQNADVVVIGVPMYNFAIPSQLKNWLDAVTRNGVTFRYSAEGPQGLLAGKTVYLAFARGGRYRETAQDSQTPYLKTILSFIGLNAVQTIYAEGLNISPEAAQQGFAEAEAQIEALFS